MYACDYLENGILNALRGVTFAAPATQGKAARQEQR